MGRDAGAQSLTKGSMHICEEVTPALGEDQQIVALLTASLR